ncbi:hypothetical protein CCP3SC15_210014 [Gammaproteobacteria bacterium]
MGLTITLPDKSPDTLISGSAQGLILPDKESTLKTVYSTVEDSSPDQAAQVIALSKKLSQPQEFIDKHLPEAQKAAQAPDNGFWNELERDYPGTSRYLRDPQNMSVAKDDIGNLQMTEKILQGFSRLARNPIAPLQATAVEASQPAIAGWKSGKNQETLNDLSFDRFLGNVNPAADSQIESIRAQRAIEQPPESGFQKSIHGVAQFGPWAIDSMINGAKYGIPAAGLAGLVTSESGPGAIAFAGAAGGVAFTAGVTEYNFRQMTGQAYDDYRHMLDKNNQPISDTNAKIAAALAGAAQTGLGFIKLNAILKTIPGSQEVVDALTKQVGTKVIESAGYKAALWNFAKTFATSVAEGTASMVGITGLGIAGGEAAKAASGQPFEHISAGEVFDQLYETAKDSAWTFGLIALPGTSAKLGFDMVKAHEAAQLTKDLHLAVADAAGKSKVLDRLPEGYQFAFKQAAEGSGKETAFIPAQDFVTYFQEKKIDPAVEADRLGVTTEQLKTAVDTGGDISVPYEKLVTTYAKSEHLKGLADDVKFAPEDLTLRQAQEHTAAIGDQMGAEFDKAKEATQKQAQNSQEFDQAYNFYKTRQEQAGNTTGMKDKEFRKLVDSNAQVAAKRDVIEARLRGISVNELLTGRPLEIKSGLRPDVPLTLDIPKVGNTDAKTIIEQSGGIFKGIQKGSSDLKLPDLAVFDNPKKHEGIDVPDTLTVPLSELTPEKVKQALEANDKTYMQGGLDQLHNHPARTKGFSTAFEGEVKSYFSQLRDAAKDPELIQGGEKDVKQNGKKISGIIDEAERLYHSGDVPGAIAKSEQALSYIHERADIQNGPEHLRQLFQGETDPLAKIDMYSGGKGDIISLFKADASSLMHELSHRWLDDKLQYVLSGKADEAYLKDWAHIKDWLKIEDGQTELTKGPNGQQEKFARSFEAYLREGKAPSEGLEKAFSQFKRWLLQIYKNGRDLQAEISPEIRGVFDRMLATEEEISFSEREMGYTNDIDFSKLPKDIAEKVKQFQVMAHDEAVDLLYKKQVEDMTVKKKEYKDALAKATQEATDYVANQSINKTIKEYEKNVGEDPHAAARQFIDKKLTEEQATKFELFAEQQGYSCGDELAQGILKKRDDAEYTKYIIDRNMAHFFDMPKIQDEAMRIVHSEKQLELLAYEKAILDELLFHAEVSLRVREAKREQSKTNAGTARQKAMDMLYSKPVKEATAYLPYSTAERNAAIKAVQAMGRDDMARAAKYKGQQMMNHALFSESMKIKKLTDKWEVSLENVQSLKKESFKKEENFNQVASLLDRFGFSRNDYAPQTKTESLSQWAERLDKSTNILNIPDWIMDESIRKDYKDLNPAQLKDVLDAVKNMRHADSMENRTFRIMNSVDIDTLVAQLKTVVEKNVGKIKTPSLEPGKFDYAKSLAAKYSMNLKKIETILQKADGWKDNGKWQQTFWEPVYKASNDESVRMKKVNEGLAKIWSVYSNKERSAMINDKKYYPELGTDATKIRLIVMALNLGNEGNRERLFGSRPIGATTPVWGRETAMRLLENNLTAKDWDFVQSAWNLIGKLWPDASKMHKELTGFTPGKVEAVPFTVNVDGVPKEMAGGYFPLKQDSRGSFFAEMQETMNDPLYAEKNPSWKAVTKTGYTKARAEAAKYPVALDITIINKHLRDVVHDIAFRPAIIDLRRIMENKDLQETVRNTLGPEAYSTMHEWLGSIASGSPTGDIATREWEHVVKALRRRTSVAMLFFRPSVIIQNLANPILFPGAVEGFGVGDALHGFFVREMMDYIPKQAFNWKAAAAMREFVYAKSAFMRDRAETPDYSLMETHARLFGKDKAVQELGIGLMSGSDNLTNIPMWLEAYNKKLAEKNDEYEAVKYADQLINRVTGSGRKMDAPGIMRGGELAKSMSMFYSFMNTEYNRWSRETGIVKQEPKNLPRYLGFVASRVILFNVASLLLSGHGPGEGDDKVKWWLKQLLTYNLQLLPGLRDFGSVAADELLGLHSFGYRPSPVTGSIDAGLKFLSTGMKVKKGTANVQDLAESASKVAAFAYPYPDQFNAWFANAYDYMVNGMAPEFGDLYRRRPKRDRTGD